LRYGLMILSERWFSWKQKGTDFPRKRGIRDPRSALPGDLPPRINALRVPRAFNAHALIFPLRHTAPRLEVSFLSDMFSTILDSCKLVGLLAYSLVRKLRISQQANQLTSSPNAEWWRIEAGQTLNIHPWTIPMRYRNIDLLPIGYAFRPDLRTD